MSVDNDDFVLCFKKKIIKFENIYYDDCDDKDST